MYPGIGISPVFGRRASGIVEASGGTIVVSGGLTRHIFNSTGNLTVTSPGWARILQQGGGGGGGCANTSNLGAGGGGGGETVRGYIYLVPGVYTMTIGAAGAGSSDVLVKGANGGDTYVTFSSNIVLQKSIGGGGGGSQGAGNVLEIYCRGANGANGGGSAGVGGAFAGGLGLNGNPGGLVAAVNNCGAGGGGSSEAGLPVTTTLIGTDGGEGIEDDLSGTAIVYGEGGGGSTFQLTPTIGGTGNGGQGGYTDGVVFLPPTNAVANTGSGGGGNPDGPGSNGSAGRIVIAYPTISALNPVTTEIDYKYTDTPLVATCPITTGAGYTYTTVFKASMPDFLVGDYLIVNTTGRTEVTEAYGFQHTAFVALTQNSVFSITDPTLILVVPFFGYNIQPEDEFGEFPSGNVFRSPRDCSGYYLHFVWYFAADVAGPGDTVAVVSGHLDCTILRP